MSNRALKIAIALSIVLAPPATSFARGFARHAGSAETGNVPIRSIPRGPTNTDEPNNETVDPRNLGNASIRSIRRTRLSTACSAFVAVVE
jgi:hypothetical protein